MFSAAADLQFSSDTYPRDSVRYAHLLEGGRILLGLMDGLRNIAIFIESLSHIEAAIQRRYLQGNSTGTRLAKVANLPLMSRRCMLNVYSFARVRPSFGLVCFVYDQIPDTCSSMSFCWRTSVGPCEGWDPQSTFVRSITGSPLFTRASFIVADSSAQARMFSFTNATASVYPTFQLSFIIV